ncbi:MAG: metallophosphoesterase, partial [Pseudomonadota bacterium]
MVLRRLKYRKQPGPDASVPTDTVLYVVGDIHGHADRLAEIHRAIDRDAAGQRCSTRIEIYLGDYVDRGPDAAAVLDRLIERAGRRWVIALRGNHEAVMQDALLSTQTLNLWCGMGGYRARPPHWADRRHPHRRT